MSQASTQRTTRTPDAPSYVVATVVICLLLLVASAGVLVWSAVSANGADKSSSAQDATELAASAKERQEILELAETFLVQALTYDWRAIPGYQERVHPLLTPEHVEQFDNGVEEGLSKIAEQNKVMSEVVFRVAAIKSLSPDSAEVLVAGNGTSRSKVINRVFFPRLLVVMEKVDGEWLVASFEDLGGGSTVVGP